MSDSPDKPESEESASPTAPAGGEAKAKPNPLLAAGPPILLVILAVAFLAYPYLQADSGASPASSSAPAGPSASGGRDPGVSPEVLALLADLKPGMEVGPFDLVRIGGPRRKRIEVEFRRDNAKIRIFIVRKGTAGFATPTESEKYSAFYGRAEPREELVSDEDALSLVTEVMKRVKKNEAAIAMPPGL